MSNPKTYSELVKLISAILPEASFDEDNYGQIVVYTALTETRSDTGEFVLEPCTEE